MAEYTPRPSATVSPDDGRQLALLNYILYFIGFFTGVTAVIGLIIAYLKRSEAAGWVQSHFLYQIRTFWIGLFWLALGALTSFIFIGYLLWVWWLAWTLVRCVKGLMRLNDTRPIDDPLNWFW